MGLIYIFITLILTVYGQLILKWQVNNITTKAITPNKIDLIWQLLLNPWVMSGFLAAFLAALSWMLAISKMQLSYAYPFMSLSFVLVVASSGLFFHEAISLQKILGTTIIMFGIIVINLNRV